MLICSKKPLLFSFALFACLTLGFGKSTSAQEGLVLTISPLKFELEAKKGETVIKEVTLSNSSGSKVSIKAGAKDFVAAGEEGKPRFVSEEQSPWSMSRWIKARPARFELQPGERRKIRVIIKVPKDAEPGGHYAAALFSSTPSKGGQTGVVARLGSLILLRVPGKIVEKGRITSLIVPRLIERGPIDIRLRFENEGNVHIKPKGKLRIWRLRGRETAALDVGGENVLPKSTRLFETKWKKVPSWGIFMVQGRLKYGAKERFAASSKTILFVMPWRLILFVLTIFLLGLILGLMVRRRKKTLE